MKTKQSWLIILILVIGLFLSGCGSNTSPDLENAQLTKVMQNVQSTLTQIAVETQYVSPQPTATNTAIPPTRTPQPEPTATQTTMPTVQPQTQTPLPIATAAVMVIPDARITFGAYANRLMVVGMVKANTTQRYILNGMTGQTFDIVLSSGQACSLSISGKDGTVLVNSLSDNQHFQGKLTSTQDWFIDIIAGGSNIDFVLYLTLP